MSFFDANALSILPHELGHHFGLPHTFGMTFPAVGDATDYVLSGRPTEAWDGDRSVITDTPPNPDIVELRTNTTVDAVALGGQTFRIDRRNITSYSSHGGTGILRMADRPRAADRARPPCALSRRDGDHADRLRGLAGTDRRSGSAARGTGCRARRRDRSVPAAAPDCGRCTAHESDQPTHGAGAPGRLLLNGTLRRRSTLPCVKAGDEHASEFDRQVNPPRGFKGTLDAALHEPDVTYARTRRASGHMFKRCAAWSSSSPKTKRRCGEGRPPTPLSRRMSSGIRTGEGLPGHPESE
jgi:hypothetical protein